MSSLALEMYIHKEMESNISNDKIAMHLLAVGYNQSDIDDAFAAIRRQSRSPDVVTTFSDFAPNYAHPHRFVRTIVGIFLCLVIAFTVFCTLYDLGFIDQSIIDAVQNNVTESASVR
ncbi:MAG: hypothetical protein P4L61_00790 [Candidatus Pacebacteria bacterium]|nr:hypothetical protein [Candidatus Paceibacterota bacterium]